jgi:nitrogen fixation/metabolism regulation signal transduction histidine kinase
MNRSNAIFLRICAIFIATAIGFVLLKNNLIYSSLFVFFVFILLIVELFHFIKNSFLFYDKTIRAILQNDFSAEFSKNKFSKSYASLFELYENLKTRENEQVSKDIIYSSILNTIETGILILQKGDKDWSIFLMNDYFSKHFQVPKVSKWHYLKNQLPSLCEIIEAKNFEEIKTSLQIRVNKQDTQTFVMQTSRSKTFHQEYYVVVLNSVQTLIEKKEKEAWINLMKVISHELLNSITPIRSLSQNLYEIAQQDRLSEEDLDDMRQSVSTMLNRSDHLQQFVEGYRKLAMLPSPNKQKIALSDWIENGLLIMSPLFKTEAITVTNTITFDRWLWIDQRQMEQVLINLLTNSLFALRRTSKKQITISAEAKEKRIFITISDTGEGVEKEIEDKIFLPFFTTRKEGAGIGLTLSKNIVEAHGGYLVFQNDEKTTRFVICLME